MKRFRIPRVVAWSVLGLAALPCLLLAIQVAGYLDFSAITAPSNPASGGRVFYNTSTGKLACLDSAGADCMPSGGGGGGGSVLVGSFASLPACTSSQFVYYVTYSPLTAFCDGSSGLFYKAFGASFPGPVLLNSTFTETVGSSATWGQSSAGPMTVTVGATSTNEARLKALPGSSFTATLYFTMDAGRDGSPPQGASQFGLMVANAAKTKAYIQAYTVSSSGGAQAGGYVCSANIDTCSQAGERSYTVIPNTFLIVRITSNGSVLNGAISIDGGTTFVALGGAFISSIDDVAFVGPYGISATFNSQSASFYALEVQ